MANEPKYVRLTERLRGRSIFDINSGWGISGNDVQAYPEGRAARSFVRSRLNQGVLEPAATAEAEEIQERREQGLEELVEQRRAELVGPIPLQEGALRVHASRAAQERRERHRREAEEGTPEETSDEAQGEEIPQREEDDYPSWKVPQLREELSDRDLDTSGNKAELVARLREADEESSDEE